MREGERRREKKGWIEILLLFVDPTMLCESRLIDHMYELQH